MITLAERKKARLNGSPIKPIFIYGTVLFTTDAIHTHICWPDNDTSGAIP